VYALSDFQGRTSAARKWFAIARHKIRDGKVSQVLQELRDDQILENLAPQERKTLQNLITYLETHKDHMNYDEFKAMGLPIGSGIY